MALRPSLTSLLIQSDSECEIWISFAKLTFNCYENDESSNRNRGVFDFRRLNQQAVTLRVIRSLIVLRQDLIHGSGAVLEGVDGNVHLLQHRDKEVG